MVLNWREIGQYRTSVDWQSTEVFQSRWLRIRTLSPTPLYARAYIGKGELVGDRVSLGGVGNFLVPFYPQSADRVIELTDAPLPFALSGLWFRRAKGRRYQNDFSFAVDELMDYDPMRAKKVFDVTQADLQNGLFDAVHNMHDEYVDYKVWDSSNKNVEPGEVLVFDGDTVIFDFTDLMPIVGTYKLVVWK